MSTVLLVIHIMVALALVVVILLQRSSSDGLGGLGGGGANAFLSGRASANLLTRTTAILATLFIVNSLALAVIASHNSNRESLLEAIEKQEQEKQPADQGKKDTKLPEQKPSVPIAQ